MVKRISLMCYVRLEIRRQQLRSKHFSPRAKRKKWQNVNSCSLRLYPGIISHPISIRTLFIRLFFFRIEVFQTKIIIKKYPCCFILFPFFSSISLSIIINYEFFFFFCDQSTSFVFKNICEFFCFVSISTFSHVSIRNLGCFSLLFSCWLMQ